MGCDVASPEVASPGVALFASTGPGVAPVAAAVAVEGAGAADDSADAAVNCVVAGAVHSFFAALSSVVHSAGVADAAAPLVSLACGVRLAEGDFRDLDEAS